jgi:hydrogenase maturation protease
MNDEGERRMPKVLILGWGNPLRGDDGVAWRAAEQIGRALEGSEATVRVAHQLLPEFAAEIDEADVVIFVDAACDNGPFGKVRFDRVEPRCSESAAFSHQMDPPALLGMAQALYGSHAEAYFFTVSGRSFAYGEELSPEVQAALPELLARIRSVCGGKRFITRDSRKAT